MAAMHFCSAGEHPANDNRMKTTSPRHGDYSLREIFPREALREARRHGDRPRSSEIKGRLDCRRDPVITIDPPSARDLDDAFSLQRTSKGHWRMRVHIADVSHYVRPGSALDEEAQLRGNSTYLVDRVIPMLPENLSNGLCSLLPGTDRLSKCVELLLTNTGRVLHAHFGSAVMRSQRAFSYKEAMLVISGQKTRGVPFHLVHMIRQASRLAQRIRNRRLRAGSLDFSSPETTLHLDRRGHVTGIEQVEHDQSHQLIEELMLLVNEAVARRLRKLRRPSIHRAHERPDPERLRRYRKTVQAQQIACGDLSKQREVQRLFERLEKSALGPALQVGFLRSLNRAHYTTRSLGHYGLAKTDYAHFTSPIRRYADLVVHRALFGNAVADTAALRKVAAHISETERTSCMAERESKRRKICAFLESQLRLRVPPAYSALVTDVRPHGLFINIDELGIGGFVPSRLLGKRAYTFHQASSQFRNLRAARSLKLGDRVRVQPCRIDPDRFQVTFSLASPPRKPRSRTRPSQLLIPHADRGLSRTSKA